MELLQWGPRFEIGIAEIDVQHRELFRRVNEFVEACTNMAGDVIVEEILAGLFAYAETHFASEEGYMRKIGYPGLAGHRAIHDAFRVEIAQFRHDLQSGKPETGPIMARFMVNWLAHHVAEEDQKLKGLE